MLAVDSKQFEFNNYKLVLTIRQMILWVKESFLLWMNVKAVDLELYFQGLWETQMRWRKSGGWLRVNFSQLGYLGEFGKELSSRQSRLSVKSIIPRSCSSSLKAQCLYVFVTGWWWWEMPCIEHGVFQLTISVSEKQKWDGRYKCVRG